jgi:predicted AAA+ superfamily ATPase
MLDEIIKLSRDFIATRMRAYERYFIRTVPLKHRFAIILGERGVGKTTTLIQYLLKTTEGDQLSNDILYVQADHLLIGTTTLYEIAESFYQRGGKVIAIDEVHKYQNWSMELKSIYDTFPNLRILASGSSALQIFRGSHDLSRRALVYRMVGLSLREYIALKQGIELPSYTLNDILNQHESISRDIIQTLNKRDLKILALFNDFLRCGYYPYYFDLEIDQEYWLMVEQNIHATLESDLVAVHPSLTGNSIHKLKLLVTFISQSVPFSPNWKKIKDLIGVSDDRTIKSYFKYLEDGGIVRTLSKNTQKLSGIESDQKIYLSNTNQLFALNYDHVNPGSLRETYFLSMLCTSHDLSIPEQGDFWIDNDINIEVGGKNKDSRQIKSAKKGYLALDDIETGIDHRIPLWLFGFIY